MLLEVEVELEDTPVKRTLESMPLGHFPLSIDDCERDILVRGASMEADRESVIGAVRLEVELWRLRLVCQVRVEDVELVALDYLGRRVLGVVVGRAGGENPSTHAGTASVVRHLVLVCCMDACRRGVRCEVAAE